MGFQGHRIETLYEVVDITKVDPSHNSVACFLGRSGGYHLEKTITLDANNTSDVKTLFTFTQSVRIFGLHFEVIDATTLVNCTGLYFDAWDGTTPEVLTLNGAVISGFAVDSFGIKDLDASAAITVANADQVRMIEPAAGKKSHQPFVLTAKSGQTDSIRMHYTTTDAPINAQLKVVLEYAKINGGTVQAAA